jgi:hypothetical protein
MGVGKLPNVIPFFSMSSIFSKTTVNIHYKGVENGKKRKMKK